MTLLGSLLVAAATACILLQRVDCRVRTFYLAAVETDWDYAPMGNRVNEDVFSDTFIKPGPDRIGSVYSKILYRQFTDQTFTRQVASDPALGMLGPVLRAEMGDELRVVFKNMALTANRNFSVHPHGVQYNKNGEGALYEDNTTGSDKEDDGVPPGQQFTYVWRVTPSFSPTPDDDLCLPWAYHSHVASPKDIESGLVGLLLTCKKGTLGSRTGRRRDVEAEFPIYVDTTDENDSWLVSQNLQRCGDPSACTSLVFDPSFQNSNIMSHMNGRVFGNLEGLDVRVGKTSVFYFFALNRDINGVHISGQVLSVNGQRMDTITLFPATFVAAFMTPSVSGYWLMRSRVAENYEAGQQAYVRVEPSGDGSTVRKRRPAMDRYSPDSHDSSANVRSTPQRTLDSETKGARPHSRGRRHAANSHRIRDNSNQEQGTDHKSGGTTSSYSRPSQRRNARSYYLGIEDYVWDYGPSGKDLYNGGLLNASGSLAAEFFTRGPDRIGGRYKKSRYVQYTSATFQTRVSRDQAEVHLGMLGPVLKAEVGETVTVTVKNMGTRPYSFLPHGVEFQKKNEGFVYINPSTNQLEGKVVEVGNTATYRFQVPALGHDDQPCVIRSYHSAVDPVKDINTGLLEPLLLCDKGQLRESQRFQKENRKTESQRGGRARGETWFQRHTHFFLNFFTLDENLSWHLQDNIDTFTFDPAGVDVNDAGFRSANRKHAINGLMYANLEGLAVCKEDDVAWHLFGVGGDLDMHGVNFQGQTLELTGNNVQSKVVVPGTAITLTSSPDVVGNWSVACRVIFHFARGMVAKYAVSDCGSEPSAPWQSDGVTRRYYVAAQEVDWDYAPLKRDLVTGENFTNDSQTGYIFVKDTDEFIGSVYKKARYIEYTDATFTTAKVRTPEQEHLGVLGPVLQAEVGDVMEVVFFNNASRSFSMHPQGVQYDKANEGARYEDGAGSSLGDAVGAGQTYTYTWRVPARAGPGNNDPDCVPWMYYSSVDSVKDVYSGLVGPLLVCRPNTLATTPSSGGQDSVVSRQDVDREFWQLYFVFDENNSWYLDDNIRERAPARTNPRVPGLFTFSNLMFSVNGRIFGNVQGMTMDEGDVVAWYLLGLGSNNAYHPVHFHGQTFTLQTQRTHRADVVEVFPQTSAVVRMECDNPGTWIVHCHFAPHVQFGMEATYTIRPAAAA